MRTHRPEHTHSYTITQFLKAPLGHSSDSLDTSGPLAPLATSRELAPLKGVGLGKLAPLGASSVSPSASGSDWPAVGALRPGALGPSTEKKVRH